MNRRARSSTSDLVVSAGAVVGVPLLYGLFQTLSKTTSLFG